MTGNGNNETEWAKEGRRIIPLLKRATPITAFTALADDGSEIMSNTLNKSLPSPLATKTEPKKRTYTQGYAMKYSQRTPPKDLSEMVTKVKEDENVRTVVRTPNLAMPPMSAHALKNYTNYFGGE